MNALPASPVVASPPAWDQRLEKYGWFEALANYVADYGVDLSIGTDERGSETMIMDIENVHLKEPDLKDESNLRGLKVNSDEGTGMVRIEVPFRHIVSNFSVAIDTLVVKRDRKTGDQALEQGPKNAHSGYFFFHVFNIDWPDTTKVEFGFRSDYTDEDVERRQRRRAGR